MEEDKSIAGPPIGTPGEPPCRAESSSQQIPIFSRNLELNSSEAKRPGSLRPEKITPPMKPADRILYFKVEAGKVLEIIQRRISGINRESVSIDLIKDIHSSWCTLWKGDDEFPVGPFTEMFDIAFSIMSSEGRLSRKLDEMERSLLVSLVQAMSELAGGRADVGYLESCRLLMEKSRQLGSRLELESRVKSKAAGPVPAKAAPAAAEVRPAEKTPKADISFAVDEWFDQVTSLMVEHGGKTRMEIRAGGPADSSAGRVAQAPASPPVAGTDESAKEGTGPVNEESLAGKMPTAGDLGKTSAIRREAVLCAQGTDSGEPVRDTDETGPLPAETAESAWAESSSQAALDVVSAYFRECCDRTLAVINRYLERLEASSPKRTSRRLSDCLEELRRLADNLEMAALIDDLSAMCRALEDLSRAPKVEIGREKARVREGLRRLVAKLEKTVFSSPP